MLEMPSCEEQPDIGCCADQALVAAGEGQSSEAAAAAGLGSTAQQTVPQQWSADQEGNTTADMGSWEEWAEFLASDQAVTELGDEPDDADQEGQSRLGSAAAENIASESRQPKPAGRGRAKASGGTSRKPRKAAAEPAAESVGADDGSSGRWAAADCVETGLDWD